MGMGSQLTKPEILEKVRSYSLAYEPFLLTHTIRPKLRQMINFTREQSLHNLDLQVEFMSSHGQSHGARPVNTSKYFPL
jgi:hypothetical protein